MPADACDGSTLIIIVCCIQMRLTFGWGYLSRCCRWNYSSAIFVLCRQAAVTSVLSVKKKNPFWVKPTLLLFAQSWSDCSQFDLQR